MSPRYRTGPPAGRSRAGSSRSPPAAGRAPGWRADGARRRVALPGTFARARGSSARRRRPAARPRRARAHLRRRPGPAAHARDRRAARRARPPRDVLRPRPRRPRAPRRRPRRCARRATSSPAHGDDHRLLALASPAEVRASSRAAENAVREATGEPPAPLFRAAARRAQPVAGARGRRGRLPRLRVGRQRSSTPPCPASTTIVERVGPLLRPGAVILLHDGDGSGRGASRAADGRRRCRRSWTRRSGAACAPCRSARCSPSRVQTQFRPPAVDWVSARADPGAAEQGPRGHPLLLGDQGAVHDGRRDGVRLPRDNVGLGLTKTTFITGGAARAVLVVQFRARRYVPPVYWLAVVLISVVGTQITDNLTDNFGVSLVTTTIVFCDRARRWSSPPGTRASGRSRSTRSTRRAARPSTGWPSSSRSRSAPRPAT